MAEVRAPYQFVPFSNKVLIRYEDPSQLPPHDRVCSELKTGEIHITMTAETPVFVSDGAKNPETGKQDPHFFRLPDGTYALPGSTIRGMVRANMQILGLGIVRPGEDLEDIQIYFREMASARGSTAEQLKKHYTAALDVESRKSPSGKSYTIPKRVQAGYLRCAGGSYYIQPVQDSYLRVSRNHPDIQAFGPEEARTVPVVYTASKDQVKGIRRGTVPGAGEKAGVLLYTGKSVGLKNHRYLFPKADESANPEYIQPEDILSYQVDLEHRRNSLKAYYDVSFWELPKEGEEKPVFYVSYHEHLYFGMSLFLRVGYPNLLSVGLPNSYKKRLAEQSVVLDYPNAVLGFAQADQAYRSRVSFADLKAQGNPKEMNPVQVILGEPKPSFYPAYVLGGKNYTDDDFRLRGYKQYWLKPETPVKPEKVNVASTLRPLPKGTVFRGVIRYKNLHPDELGLLLWSLCLEDGCFQSVGMGRPYGYGRMKLEIDSLHEFDLAAMYRPGGLCGEMTVMGDVEACLSDYQKYALSVLKLKKQSSLKELDERKDFFYLRRTIRNPSEVGYMDLKGYQESKKWESCLPVLQELREAAEKMEAEEQAQEESSDLASLLAKWQANTGSVQTSKKSGRKKK